MIKGKTHFEQNIINIFELLKVGWLFTLPKTIKSFFFTMDFINISRLQNLCHYIVTFYWWVFSINEMKLITFLLIIVNRTNTYATIKLIQIVQIAFYRFCNKTFWIPFSVGPPFYNYLGAHRTLLDSLGGAIWTFEYLFLTGKP